MSEIDFLLLFWAVPSLVTLLIMLAMLRIIEDADIYDLNPATWVVVIVMSVFYPIGLLCFWSDIVLPWLIKERSLTKKD